MSSDPKRPYDLRAWGYRRSKEDLAVIAEAVIAALCERICPLPNGMEHESDFLRLTHADLDGMGSLELQDARARARLRLMLEEEPPSWLLDRVRRVEERMRVEP